MTYYQGNDALYHHTLFRYIETSADIKECDWDARTRTRQNKNTNTFKFAIKAEEKFGDMRQIIKGFNSSIRPSELPKSVIPDIPLFVAAIALCYTSDHVLPLGITHEAAAAVKGVRPGA